MTKLPLPSPRSPSGLDKKILAYAKQQLPEKKAYRPPLWLSGLATASVVAIAVIIATPEQLRVIEPAAQPARLSTLPEKAEDAADSPRPVVTGSADTEMIARRSARKQSAPLAASASFYAEDDMAAVNTMSILDSTTIHAQLREMATLVERGDSKQAALDYRELKKLCPHCELPATVEEAIEQYLTNE